MFLVRVAYRGEYRHVGADDAFQAFHFAGLRNPRLEDGQLLVALQHQHRKRHPQLRIVALGRAVELHARGQFFGYPFLDDGLAVRARDAYHRALELRPMIGRQRLQGSDGVLHHCIAAVGQHVDFVFDQKGPHAAFVHLPDEAVRIVVGSAQSHEHRAPAHLARERAAVGHHRAYFGVAAPEFPAAQGGYPRKSVFHTSKVSCFGSVLFVCRSPGSAAGAHQRCGPTPGGQVSFCNTQKKAYAKVTTVMPAPPRSACSSTADSTSGTVRR